MSTLLWVAVAAAWVLIGAMGWALVTVGKREWEDYHRERDWAEWYERHRSVHPSQIQRTIEEDQ